MTVVFLLAGDTSWTPPAGVTSVKVECLGPGGNGVATGTARGGGGGGYDSLTTFAVTPGVAINCQVGAAGSQNDTWFNSTATVIGRAGTNATGAVNGAGGAAGVGGVTFAGGAGNVAAGGGAGGPNGTGKAGGLGNNSTGGGGGGANGGAVGGNGSAGQGGAGGNGRGGTGGGVGATSAGNATAGTSGGGGGGSFPGGFSGAAGGQDTIWTRTSDGMTAGPGGGGGGARGAGLGGDGGGYGGGGGAYGLGSPGIIVLTYTASAAIPAGMATETDTGFALAAKAILSTGLSSSSSLALALAQSSILATGQATESDMALALQVLSATAPGISFEAQAAFWLAATIKASAGIASEGDTAIALSQPGPSGIAVGRAGEIETAFALIPGKIYKPVIRPSTSKVEQKTARDFRFAITDTSPMRVQKLEIVRNAIIDIMAINEGGLKGRLSDELQADGFLVPDAIPVMTTGSLVTVEGEGDVLQTQGGIALGSRAWLEIGGDRYYESYWRFRVVKNDTAGIAVAPYVGFFIYDVFGQYLGDHDMALQANITVADGWREYQNKTIGTAIKDQYPAAAYVRAALIRTDEGLAISQVSRFRLTDVTDIEGVGAMFDGVYAAITEERNIRISEDEAMAQIILTLEASVGDAHAAIYNEQLVRANADSALALDITSLSVEIENDLGDLSAAIYNEQLARVDGDGALASSITSLSAEIDGDLADISASVYNEQIARADGDSALASSITALEASIDGEVDDLYAAISTEAVARVDGDSANADLITTLTSTVNDLTAEVMIHASTLVTLEGYAEARLELVAVAGSGRAQLTLHADANGGGGVDIVGDVSIDGDLMVSGTINRDKLDISSLVKKVSLSGPTANPISGTSIVIDEQELGETYPFGSYQLDCITGIRTNVGVLTSTYMGLPLYTYYIPDGGVFVTIIKDGVTIATVTFNGAEYQSSPSATRTIAYDRVDLFDLDDASIGDVVIKSVAVCGNYDSGIVNDGDYYIQNISATYQNMNSIVKAKWVFI